MNMLLNLTCLCVSTLLVLSGCSNTTNNSNKETAQQQHHDGHDHHGHADHDHSHHDHTHEATTPAESSNGAEHTTEQPQAKESSTEQNTTADITQAAPSANIPAFTFYKVKSGISFTEQDIPKGQKAVFILFDPSCSHCRQEANALGKNYDLIKDLNLYFVSMNDPALMASFLETFAKELANKPNVQVLYDRKQEFIQKFHVPKQFPANYVYSKEGKLETFWDGDKNIKEIIAAYTK